MAKTKPTHSFRLQCMSIPELTEGMVKLRMRLNRKDVKHRDRKLKDGPLLNAVVAWVLDQPAAEQERIAREGLVSFEAILNGMPGPTDGLGASASVPVADELDISPSNSDRPPAATTTPGRRKGAAG